MSQPNRIAGGQIDDKHALSFRWNGRNLTGYAGDI